ncbi:SH3 domain-containing protein [Neobacillus mesonae]|uniref:SH3 domain-containing protein n=1 Tax=Neobacillus mesonae TaxID=1193713 RepID=UPI002E227B22|nr:SH3 domain-containing protein [Neobacillus mesonae]
MAKLSFCKYLVGFVFILSFCLTTFSSVEAATTPTTSFVTAKKISVRTKASTSAKVLGTLKQGTRVAVYTKTKSGWAKIKYKNKTAYVPNKSLQTSFLMNKSKIYIYKEDGLVKNFKYKKRDKGWDLWNGSYGEEMVFKETVGGLLQVYGGAYSENVALLKYPLKTGKSWDNWIEAYKYRVKITSTTKTVKTPAGTFKNCVEVKDGSYVSYFAPNVGFVKGIEKGKVHSQLIKLKKR